MRLTLPELSDLETDGFTKNDIFGYREFGERFADIVSDINEPLVIALDGPWGSGKSVFIKQWAGLIEQRGDSFVYFDAFKNDIHQDAFLALASEIYSLARKNLEGEKSSIEKFLDTAKNVSKALAPMGFHIALHTGALELLNPEYVNMAKETIKTISGEIENKTEKAFEKVIYDKLKKTKEERELFESFRESLKNLSNDITKKKKHNHLIFIVDELDRCRPPFALDIIEYIKHLFSVENICFVLVTNLTHLGAAIQGAYGGNINDHTYLEKFYQLKVVLPESDFEYQSQRNTYLIYLWDKLQPKFEKKEGDDIRDEIRRLANAHTLSLRQIEHVMRNIVLVAAFSSRLAPSSLLVTTSLCVMRQTAPKLYALARENNLSWKEVKDFLKIDKDNDVSNSWRYISDPEVSEKIETQYSGFWRTRFSRLDLPRQRLLLQRVFTNEIDSLLGG